MVHRISHYQIPNKSGHAELNFCSMGLPHSQIQSPDLKDKIPQYRRTDMLIEVLLIMRH
jgi:hypothetical protein